MLKSELWMVVVLQCCFKQYFIQQDTFLWASVFVDFVKHRVSRTCMYLAMSVVFIMFIQLILFRSTTKSKIIAAQKIKIRCQAKCVLALFSCLLDKIARGEVFYVQGMSTLDVYLN